MPIQPFQPHYPFTDEKLAQLKQIVPEAFEDGRLNFDTLREVLEPNLDPEGTISDDGERFGLLWPGKKEARRLAAIPSKGTLAPVYGQGLKADGTPDTDGTNDSRNVFIEGENLEVLKIMQKAYAGRVKMIYIDPPYNTGNDFVYDDNFTEPLEHYLRRTGQIDDEGQKLTTNTKADGRFHSKWLSMMYPRLRLARNLLREDGVIFVSIDDNEVHNLRQLMNEVFGEENFVGQWNWWKSSTPPNLSYKIKKNIEFILCYERQRNTFKYKGLQKESSSDDPLTKPQNSIKDLCFPVGSINISRPDSTILRGTYGTKKYPNELLEDLKVVDRSNANLATFRNRFVWTQHKLETELEAGTVINLSKNGVLSYKKGKYDPEVPPNFIPAEIGDTTENAGKELTKMLGAKVFDYPKPMKLLKYLMGFILEEDSIILDFFAGSGSIAQAVLEYNAENNSNHRFMAVQMPEKVVDNSNYKFISDITLERIKASVELRPEEKTGVRRFALYERQIKIQKIESLQDQFDFTEKTYNPTTLLWEVALNEGFPLDSRVETREVAGQTIQTLTSEFHEFALHCCFDPTVAPAAAPEITLGENDVLVCLDSALDDQTKLRLSDKGLLKTI